MIDLLVTAGTVITVDENRRVLFDGAVAIDRGRVVAVGPGHEVTTEYLATSRVDVPAGLAMPG